MKRLYAIVTLTFILYSRAFSQAVPELMYFRMDAATGTSTPNAASAPVSPNGTLNGATIGGTGQFNTALLGNGGTTPTNSLNANWALNLSGPWTISMWFSGVTNTITSSYLFGGAGGSTFRAFTGSGLVSGAGNLLVRGTGMTDVPINGIFDAAGTPVVVHIVYDPTTPAIRAYVNGVLATTVAQTATMTLTGTDFTIGSQGASAGLISGGKMDEFRMYNRALTVTEITATWNQPLPLVPPTPCAGQPSAGTASSSAAAVCSTQTFNLSLTGSTNATGISIQWQSRVGTTGPWTNIAGATTPTYAVTGQVSASQYRAYVSCANGGLGDTTLPVTVQQTLCYCVPTYANGGGTDFITNVTLGTLSNNTLAAGNPSPFYVNYTSQQPATIAIPDLKQGLSYTLSASFSTDPNQYSAVWIDFDQDGVFNSTTEYFTTNNNAGASGTINIPITIPIVATPGLTRLRIRGGDDTQPSATQACGATNSTWGEAEDYFVNIKSACDSPLNLYASNITTTTAIVHWSQNNIVPPIGYEFAVTTSSTPPATGTSTTGTVQPVNGLTPGTVYYLHVRNQCGTSIFSDWVTISFKTSDAGCAISPSALAATNITYTSADLSWNAISGVNGYEYALDQNPLPPGGSGTFTAATTFNTGTTLTAGTTYYLHVRTECAGPTYSSWTTYDFHTLACDTPSTSNVINTTVNSTTVWWNAVPGVLGYEYVVTTAATPPASGTFTTNISEPVTGLNSGTTYYLYLRSNCDANVYSAWSKFTFNTLPCSAPPATAGSITYNSAVLNWSSLPGALGYEYSFGTTATPPATGTPTTALTFSPGATLTPNTTYYFHVRAQCGPTTYSPWTTITFKTLVCLPPIGLSISNITTGSATLNWGMPIAPSSAASGYEYIIDQSNATPGGSGIFNQLTTVTVTNQSVTPFSTLVADTWYYVHVRSVCFPNAGYSDWVLDSFKTLKPCPPVTGLLVENVWFDAIDVRWNGTPYSNYYQYSVGTNSAPPSVGSNITDTFFRARGLKDNSVYYVHVRNMCSDVPTSPWQTVTFKTTGLSVNTVNKGNQHLEAYPNPVTDKVTVKWNGRMIKEASLQLTDVAGKVIQNIIMKENKVEVNMAALSAGIYFIKYNNSVDAQTIKITKE